MENSCGWRESVINIWCQHHCHCFISDPALTEDPNEVKLSSCKEPNVSLLTQTELRICVSSNRVHVGGCWQTLSKVSTPIYLTHNTTSTCPTVTNEVSSGRNRQDIRPKQITHRTSQLQGCISQINICVNTCQNQPKLCFFAPRCSAGRLEGSGAASAGVWIRTACKSHQTPVRRGAWPVRSTQNLDSGTHRGGVQDEGPQQELSLSLHQPKQHSHQGRPASETRCNLVLLRPLLKFGIKFTKQNIRQSTWTNVN